MARTAKWEVALALHEAPRATRPSLDPNTLIKATSGLPIPTLGRGVLQQGWGAAQAGAGHPKSYERVTESHARAPVKEKVEGVAKSSFPHPPVEPYGKHAPHFKLGPPIEKKQRV